MNWAKIGLFAGGALFGSAGIEILTSKDAKKLYTQCTAAVLRMKDQVMKTATSLQENCGDILVKSDFVLSFCELVMGGKTGLEAIERTVIDQRIPCFRHLFSRKRIQGGHFR